MSRRIAVRRSKIRRDNVRLHKALMRTDSDYRLAVFKDSGFDDIWSVVKAMIPVATSILSLAKALDNTFSALKKGQSDIDNAKNVITANASKLKELLSKLKNLVFDFFKMKFKFLFRIKTGTDEQEK